MRGREDARHIGEHVKIFPLPGRYLAFSKAEPAPRNQRGEKLPIGYEPVMKVRPFHSMSANPPRPLRNPYMRRPPYAYAIFIRHRTFPIRHNARKASWRPAVAAPPGPCQPPLFRLKVSEETLFKLAEELRSSVTVWLAEYNVPTPTAPLDFRIWQYSCTGTVPGISTDVDLNIWFDLPGQRSE